MDGRIYIYIYIFIYNRYVDGYEIYSYILYEIRSLRQGYPYRYSKHTEVSTLQKTNYVNNFKSNQLALDMPIINEIFNKCVLQRSCVTNHPLEPISS
jgi:hypothetical protein